MILTTKFLEALLPIFEQDTVEEQRELIYDGHHFDASLEKTEDDTLTITIKYNKEESAKDKFEKWCESIDDDIFVEACEKFEELTGKSLNEADESKLYHLFQTVVQQVVSAKIDKLKKLYNLGD